MDWVTEARQYVNKTLFKFPRLFFKVSRGFAVDLLCKELEKIPVPFLGLILSKLVKEAAKPEDTHGPGLDDVLNHLQKMKLSDDDFLQGLSEIGEDVARLEVIITSTRNDVAVLRKELTIPRLVVRDTEYMPHYPQADNELLFSLMNIGAGALKVPEIKLSIEKWEPETKVDYTAIAAPPEILNLKVRLSPGVMLYPLLELNNEPYRRFGAYSEGAEDVCIQMSSEKNARYYFRICIPYKNLSTGQEGELFYPAENQPPIITSFPYAPGWDSSITPDNMLESKAVLTEIVSTFNKARLILEKSNLSGDELNLESVNESLRDIGFTMGLEYMPYVINKFIPPVAKIIKEDNELYMLKSVLQLVHQSMRHDWARARFEFEDRSIDSLCDFFASQEMQKHIREFFSQQDEQLRQKILAEV